MNSLPWKVTALPMPPLNRLPARFTIPPKKLGGRRIIFVLDFNSSPREVVDGVLMDRSYFTLTALTPPGTRTEHRLYRQKLVYGKDVFQGAQYVEALIGIHIVPFDMRLQETEITRDNFGKRVLLYYAFNPLERQV